MIYFVVLAAVSYAGYCMYSNRINKENSAAETVIPKTQEKNVTGLVKPTTGRPVARPSLGLVSSTFNKASGSYYPISDVHEENVEGEIKSLNIANRFIHG